MLTDLVAALADAARQTGAIGVVLFFIAYVLATILVLPGSILTLAAGFAATLGFVILGTRAARRALAGTLPDDAQTPA